MTAAVESHTATQVRQAFLDQAGYCEQLGSPFTALLCRVLGEGLDPSNAIERFILEWREDPGAFGDSVPLRVAGVLHYLVRAGRSPELAALYPPHANPEPGTLLATARATLLKQESLVREFLRFPPQTNEVGRSAALIAGWLQIARATRLPLSLFEIGCSAGLNLIADRYAYRFGDVPWAPGRDSRGAANAPARLMIDCGWTGPRPAIEVPLRIQSRCGCDQNPLHVAALTERERLIAYVWADQTDRLARLEAAIRTMLSEPVSIAQSDAADWVEMALPASGERGSARVLFHSIVWSYLEAPAQLRIKNHLAKLGTTASTDRPLGWLRLELARKEQPAELRLTLWPGGDDRLLARVHPHGRWVHWCS